MERPFDSSFFAEWEKYNKDHPEALATKRPDLPFSVPQSILDGLNASSAIKGVLITDNTGKFNDPKDMNFELSDQAFEQCYGQIFLARSLLVDNAQ